MNLGRATSAALGNIRRNKRSFLLSSVGLVVGVATLTFFIHLGMGIQDGVLNRIYPVNQIEIEPTTVGIVGLREQVIDPARLDAGMVDKLRALPGVVRVYPKLRSKLQARLWGGKALFGYAARAEAFFDGLEPELLQDELKRFERVDEKRERAKLRRPVTCLRDDECPLGQECREGGTCGDVEYWEHFVDRGVAIPCSDADGGAYCPPGQACSGGTCHVLCEGADGTCAEGSLCAPPPMCASGSCPGVCAPACNVDGDCPESAACVDVRGGGKVCRRLRCELASPDLQFSDRLGDQAGKVLDRCANGVAPGSPGCEPLPCPGGTYCAALDVTTTQGFCEAPVPIVMSPVLIELFNSSAATSLGMQKIDGIDAMLGFQFRLHLGDSYFAADLPKDKQAVKRAEITGFSQKALEFGVTMPLSIVRAINARYKGQEAATTFDT
ncbi:MAG: hypothetical protein KC635_25435, partial [Myxococcales bacterium]|nr:hypothetical protein [Myxococcales bacterium]